MSATEAPRPAVAARRQTLARFGDWQQPSDQLWRLSKGLPVYASYPLRQGGSIETFLDGLPPLSRLDLRSQFPHGFLRPGVRFAELIASKTVEVVRTSGTSADRLQVLWADGWWQAQEIAALKCNSYIAARLDDGYREAVLTTPVCSENVCQTGPTPMEERCLDYLLFLNTQYDPNRWDDGTMARMLDEIRRFEPVSIDADPVYLATLCHYLRRTGRQPPRFAWIVLAYEFVTAIDKQAVRSLFDCPVFDFYGLTEAGVYFLECSAGRHHFCGQNAVAEVVEPEIERLPANVGEVIVTTWCNAAQPLIRYRSHDLVRLANDGCRCGLPGPAVERFEGRARDVLVLPDESALTPRMIDQALAEVSGLVRYRCVQEGPRNLRVDHVVANGADIGNDIRDRLQGLCGGVAVSVRRVDFVSPESSGKYRTVVPQ
jgi:phenylacetate-CoA ligase